MADNFDIKKIRGEIDKRKGEQNTQSAKLGEGAPIGQNRDQFLGDLLTSLDTGKVGPAVTKMKVVEGRSKNVEVNDYGVTNRNVTPVDQDILKHINPAQPQQPQQPQQPASAHYPQQVVTQYPQQPTQLNERDDVLYKKMSAQNQSLQSQYRGTGIVNEYNTGMGGVQQPLSSVVQGVPQPQQLNGQLNPQLMLEQIQQHSISFLNENLGKIAEEAMRNTVIEIYSKDRVKKVLEEIDIDGIIKEKVVQTILEIQNRKKNTK